jgi:hypothetical protein
MAGLSVSRFNWVRSPSAWESTQAWRTKQQEARDRFESASATAGPTFFSANANLVAGMGAIAAKIASNRLQAQAIRNALSKLA